MSRFNDTDYEDKEFTIINNIASEKLLSLEDALQPLTNQIVRLNYYIDIAKMHCHYPSSHGLTRNESAAVFIYTMEWGKQSIYHMVNKALRKKDSNIAKPWFAYLKLFITAILKLPIYNGNVWRSENISITQRFQKNQKCIWWMITSCSLTLDIMDNFMGNEGTIFAIEAKNGRDITEYSFHHQEEEVILLPGTSLHVLNSPFLDCSDMYVVSVKVFDEDKLARDYNALNQNSASSNILGISARRLSVTDDRHSNIRNNQNSSVQRNRRSPVQQDTPRRNRVVPPVPTRESREPLSCGGHACYNCQKCCDWKWNNQSNDWNRSSEATCRGIYTVDGNNHYVRGPGGGRGGGGIFPICECDM